MSLKLAAQADGKDQQPRRESEEINENGQQVDNGIHDIRKSAQGTEGVPHFPQYMSESRPGILIDQQDTDGDDYKNNVKYCPDPIDKHFRQQKLCG